MDESTIERGKKAAAAYLTKVGLSDIAESCGGNASWLTASEGPLRVAVMVTVRDGVFTPEVAMPPTPTGADRADTVEILVIGPDRALLRHRRGSVSCD